MKTSLSFACFALAIAILLPTAGAQTLPYYGGPDAAGGGVYEPAAFQSAYGDLKVGMPGRLWLGTMLANEGLGYHGPYATIGGKTRLFEDNLDGRWLFEGRGHVSIDSGGFFGNFGIERIFTIDAAGADVSLSGWVDYDDDQQGNFAHTFWAWGVNGAIKTRKWDLIGNGYFPEGTTNYAQGDPTGVNCFLNHSIVLQAGIDSALRGFDATLRMRPKTLSYLNGSIDLGGYGYDSDLVSYFGGGRARLNIQFFRGMFLSGEVNYDERFDITGGINLTWMWGANARGAEYAGLARDLERTLRNDHIVRYNQEVVLAIDPDTGRPYDVWHVDNTADAAFANGTAETEFTNLMDAQVASSAGDIIFVREGDGTVRGYDTGIILKDDQLLLGDGVEHFIPIQNGQNFLLCNDLDGNRPTITGQNNGAAVRLADNNVVSGFIIDGFQAPGGMSNGIFGSEFVNGSPVTNGIIEDNMIIGAILHGVYVDGLAGDWTFTRNEIQENGFDGILLEDACDPTSIFNFVENDVSDNGRHGIHMRNYDAEEINFLRNITDNNGGDGVLLEDFKNLLGNGLNVDFIDHQAVGNNGAGIRIVNGDGNIRFLNSDVRDNLASGIMVENWTNSVAGDGTFIGIFEDGTSTISGNGAGADAGIDVIQNVGTQRLTVMDSTVNGNGIGIRLRTDGIMTNLTANIVDNLSVNGSMADGMRFVSTGGATMNLLVEQSRRIPANLPINGSAANGISFLVGSPAGGNTSTIQAILRDVNIIGSGGVGVSANVSSDGGLDLLVEDSVINTNAQAFNFNLNTNNNLFVNSLIINNVSATDNAFQGIVLQTFGGTYTDLSVVNSVFNVTTQEVSGGINSDGILITANGNASMDNPEIDNRTRFFLQGTTINNYLLNGVNVVSNGDAHVLANIDGNTITNNGLGFIPPQGPELPFFDGINLVAAGRSRMDARISNNTLTGNFERGVDLFATDNATLNVLMVDNNSAGNDQGEDTGNDPIIDSFLEDFRAINNNVGTSNVCLSMSSNFFTFGSLIANLLPNVPSQFVLELDGNTNGFGPGIAINTEIATFGSTCEALVAAEEAAFAAAGFPTPDP